MGWDYMKKVIRLNGSLTATAAAQGAVASDSPIAVNSKQYFEFTASGSNGYAICLMDINGGFLGTNPSNYYRPKNGITWYVNAATGDSFIRYELDGVPQAILESKKNSFGSWKGAIAIDTATNSIKLYHTGVLLHDVIIPSELKYLLYVAICGCHQNNCTATFNFGETPFNYQMPEGFVGVYDAINPKPNYLDLVDEYTVALLHFNEDGFRDECYNEWETVGNPKIDTTTKKFGDGSLYLDGSYLSTPIQPSLNLSTGDFTIDWWEYITGDSSSPIISFDNSSDGSNFLIRSCSSSILYTYASSDNVNWDVLDSFAMGNVKKNIWVHRAITRKGDVFSSFEDGNLISTATSSKTIDLASVTKIRLGVRALGTPSYFMGHIDELRISKGIARWSTNFTPPTKQYEYKRIYDKIVCNSDILINMRFDDNGINDLAENNWENYNGTFIGDGKFGKKALTLSGIKGNRLQLNKNILYGLDEFTISLWCSMDDNSRDFNPFTLLDPATTYQTKIRISFRYSNSIYNTLTICNNWSVQNTNNVISTTNNITSLNVTSIYKRYVHHAIVLKNNILHYFLNGILQGTINNSSYINMIKTNTKLILYLGWDNWDNDSYSTYSSIGRIDDIVFIQNNALWTNDFFVPNNYLTDIKPFIDYKPEDLFYKSNIEYWQYGDTGQITFLENDYYKPKLSFIVTNTKKIELLSNGGLAEIVDVYINNEYIGHFSSYIFSKSSSLESILIKEGLKTEESYLVELKFDRSIVGKLTLLGVRLSYGGTVEKLPENRWVKLADNWDELSETERLALFSKASDIEPTLEEIKMLGDFKIFAEH